MSVLPLLRPVVALALVGALGCAVGPNYATPEIDAIRERTLDQLSRLDPAVLRLEEPATYAVGLDLGLYRLKEQLISQARAY